jgi:hypothetical protein
LTDGSKCFVALVHRPVGIGFTPDIKVELLASSDDEAQEFLREIRTTMRGVTLDAGHERLGQNDGVSCDVRKGVKPDVDGSGVVPGLRTNGDDASAVHVRTLGFTRHRDRLREAGLHLKRGLLLHGPPGTGKTLTAMYIVGRLPERTTLLVSGQGMGSIAEACMLARLLQPSTVILEDVDLIAEERSTQKGQTPLLLELMNQMDGFDEDADVLFLLTTNRPDVLEPALASRPGRIDASLEVPLPDAASRRALIRLYARAVPLELADEERLVKRTDGVSAAFLRELLRKAALLAAERIESEWVMRDADLELALREMLAGGKLSRSLLGFRSPVDARSS